MQIRASAHEELFELLRHLPDTEAQAVLTKIRDGTDVATILNHVKAGDVLLQMAVSPETRFRYEFPYKSEMPEEYIRGNPYLQSLIFEATSLYGTDQSTSRSPQISPSTSSNLGSREYQSPYLKPFHAAQVIESRLSDARLSSWTAVCNDDVLMRELLSVFFRCEYHFTAAFQKDLFLEDMASGQQDFCSSLLVNVMLAYACVRHFLTPLHIARLT